MQYFIVADVHSFYNEMMTALKNVGWENKEDQCFVSLGDLCDRGPDTVKCLEFVNSLPDNRKILIRGNHEDLLEQAICRKLFKFHDIHNGTVKSAEAIATYEGWKSRECGLTASDDREILDLVKKSSLWNDYIDKTVDFAEVGKNIFVHGWIPTDRYSWKKEPNWRSDSSDWDSARWMNGMQAWSEGVKIQGKTIWCGHWHTSYGHSVLHHDGVEFPEPGSTEKAHFGPFIDKGIVAMDACTAFSHKVNCLMIEV